MMFSAADFTTGVVEVTTQYHSLLLVLEVCALLIMDVRVAAEKIYKNNNSLF